MKLAASKVDFRAGCDVGATVVLAVPDVVAVTEVGVGRVVGRVVGLAVELVGKGGVVGAEQVSVLFTKWQCPAVELDEQWLPFPGQSIQKQAAL